MTHRSEDEISAELRSVTESMGMTYSHQEARPTTNLTGVTPDTVLMFHPDEFEPDDREAFRNAGEHLLRQAAPLDERGGIMARLPESIIGQFTMQAAAHGFACVDRRPVDPPYFWLAFKRGRQS